MTLAPIPGGGCSCVRCKEPVPDPPFPGPEEAARLRDAAADKRRAWVQSQGVRPAGWRGSEEQDNRDPYQWRGLDERHEAFCNPYRWHDPTEFA